jgi:hypothetical protein
MSPGAKVVELKVLGVMALSPLQAVPPLNTPAVCAM